jgi:hypothetical protein
MTTASWAQRPFGTFANFLNSADGLQLLLLLLAVVSAGQLALLELAPAVYALVAGGLPVLLVLALALAGLELLLGAALLAAFLLHLGLHLALAAHLVVDEDLAGLVAPLAGEGLGLELGAVDGPLVLADQQHARVGDGLVEPLPVLLVHQLRLRLLQAVERVRRQGVFGLVRVDQQRLLPVRELDVGLGDTRLQVEDGVAVLRAYSSVMRDPGFLRCLRRGAYVCMYVFYVDVSNFRCSDGRNLRI